MGTEAIGYVIGQQCAPVLAGIKPSNLLILEQGHKNVLQHVLRGTMIQKRLLFSSGEKEYWFLYEEEKLDRILAQPEKRDYLRTCGYDTEYPEEVLNRLSVRFTAYKQRRADFPHEMGVLFGYPLKDVTGFIENRGQNFKMSGYWKVYDDVDYAGKVFHLYETARKKVLELWGQGVCIPDICQQCRRAEYLALN